MDTPVRFRFHTELETRRTRRSRHRVRRLPTALPDPATTPSAYQHMRYAHTVPLTSRGSAAACRRRSTLVEVARALDGLVISPDRPLAFWALLDRHGFAPMNDADLTPMVTLLHEMASRLNWDVIEHRAAPEQGDGVVTVRRDEADLRIAPLRGEWLVRVLVAGNGIQVASYTCETFS